MGLANAFISVAGALKPVLPLLTAITAIKGFKFITEFLSGFKGAFGGGSIGGGMGGALAKPKTNFANGFERLPLLDY